MKPKILVIGYARHGKDTVCEILRDEFGYKFDSSSNFCMKAFIFEGLSKKYGYQTMEECYADRVNHRAEWYDLIVEYVGEDKARLGREILAENDIYCGLRNVNEFEAMVNEGVVDYTIWVERAGFPPEDKSSMTLEKIHADFLIRNNGTMDDLRKSVGRVKTLIEINFRDRDQL